MNIHQRLALVAKEIGFLVKNKKVDTYFALTYDQVIGECREWLLAHGVGIEVSCVNGATIDTGVKSSRGTPMVRFDGIFDVAFVNVEDCAERSVMRVPASGIDFGDKAPGKATTYAMKTALVKRLMIESGTDDEARITDEGLSVDRIIEVESAIEKITDIDALRTLTKAVLAEAKEARDHDAAKRFRAKSEARAKQITPNEFAPKAKMTIDEGKVSVTPETHPQADVKVAGSLDLPPETTPAEPPPTPAADKPKGPPATAGMKNVVRHKLAGRSEQIIRDRFGCGIDELLMPQVNEVLTFLKAA